jgi:hypothetical protein
MALPSAAAMNPSVEGEATRSKPGTGVEEPAVLREVAEPPPDKSADDQNHADCVERLRVEPAPPRLASRDHAADQDPDRDRDAVPRECQRADLDRRIDSDRDRQERRHRLHGSLPLARSYDT